MPDDLGLSNRSLPGGGEEGNELVLREGTPNPTAVGSLVRPWDSCEWIEPEPVGPATAAGCA